MGRFADWLAERAELKQRREDWAAQSVRVYELEAELDRRSRLYREVLETYKDRCARREQEHKEQIASLKAALGTADHSRAAELKGVEVND